jgi:hypothetical protein
VSGRVGGLSHVESGGFIGVIWGILDIKDDCCCALSGRLNLGSLEVKVTKHVRSSSSFSSSSCLPSSSFINMRNSVSETSASC